MVVREDKVQNGTIKETDPDGRDVHAVLIDGWHSLPGPIIFLGGILLPVVALIVELAFGLCGQAFYNPLPDPLHILLVGLVPLANLAVYLAIRRRRLERIRLFAFLNGAAAGVSAFYALLFVPLLPIGVIGILVYGMGLLALAPALALAASLGLRRHLLRNLKTKPRGFAHGMAGALALLFLVELPSTVTRLGMKMASSEEAGNRNRGIRLLRLMGDRDLMLRLCYGRQNRVTDLPGFLISMGKPISTEDARTFHYQALGETFNSRPAPGREPWRLFDPDGEFAWSGWDAAQGGNAVAGVVPGLSLAASRIDASIDARAALGYQEWTLEFENRSDVQAEARAQIQLPPEGVVSRLTLWVDGEEREAAFAGRGQVRQAYESVVRAQRDPVLVTTQGKDRVLMQCFPVPPGGGRMKVRLGITAPLAFSSSGEGHFHLPRFSERNFGVTGSGSDDGKKGGDEVHSIWMESDEPFLPGSGDWAVRMEESGHTLKGRRSEEWLSRGQSIAVGEGGGNHAAWAVDARLGGDRVQQKAGFDPPAPLGELLVAVDGSKGMKPYLEDVAAALRAADRPVQVFLATQEEVREYQGPAQRAGDWLERQPCTGGQDNVPALMRAWEKAPDSRHATVLWIHAAQPFLLSSPEILRQGLERQANGPRVLSVQVGNGPDRLLEDLATAGIGPMVSSTRFSGRLREELAALVSPAPAPRKALKRMRVPAAGAPGIGKRTSDHLARLLVHDEILAGLEKGDADGRAKAVAAAGLFQLVTPASGAVVLENDAQYQAAGLQPAASATVPGVPEPEAVGLVLVVAVLLGIGALRSRLRRKHV